MREVLKVTGFIAFIWVAFINAFVDLGHKILIQNTLLKAYEGSEQVILTAIINALILIPFILLFTPAGFISDRYSKAKVMRWAARFAVLLTLLITLCYYQGWFYYAFGLTFALALQSALYSPAKYGYIRDLLGSDNLSEGNSWVQSVTMVAILAGIVVFSLLFEVMIGQHDIDLSDTAQLARSYAPLGWFLVLGSVVEAFLAQRLPDITNASKPEKFQWKAYITTKLVRNDMKAIYDNKPIIRSIFGIAGFWTISQVLLAVYPSYIETLTGESNVFIIQGVMALAGIGIMAGSVIAGRMSSHYINLALVPVGAVGVAISLLLLLWVTSLAWAAPVFFAVGLFGALMIIPLNALIQFNAPKAELGTILAGSNLVQNICMLSGLLLTVLFAYYNYEEKWLLTALAIIGVLLSAQAVRTLPHLFVRALFAGIIRQKYNLVVQGYENILDNQRDTTKGMLLLGNHISWIDWALVQLAFPRRIRFVMERSFYEKWYLKWFLNFMGCIPVSSAGSKKSLQMIRKHLEDGQIVCLFPEGAISYTGQLGEFKRGFEQAIRGTDAVIVPFYLRGLWGSRFSKSSSKLREVTSRGSVKRDVIVSFGSPLDADTSAVDVKQKVFELSIQAWSTYTGGLQNIGQAFVDTCKTSGSEWAITDATGVPVSRKKLLTGALLFRDYIAPTRGQNIGLLVPTTTAGAITNMAALMAGKTLVNLNYTAPIESIMSAIEQADIRTIVTSTQFVTKLEARGLDVEPLFEGKEVLYLEDIRDDIPNAKRITTLLKVILMPKFMIKSLYCANQKLDDTAAILFSSGSEGAPKGVMLSHRNFMSNLKQIADVLNMRDDDTIMASLPLFHAFGLTVTCFLPLIEGVPVVCHPDPTDAVGVGKAVAKYKATVLCATATFLRLYSRNRRLLPIMFDSLRLTVAGAEKLPHATRELFENRFHKTLLEGYGCTETTPVASCNIPDSLDTQYWTVQQGNRLGTVGLALPGTTFRIVDPESMETLPIGEAGLILIGGTQIMKGYLNEPEKTEQAIVTLDGIRFYKTGDKGQLDEDGFLTIVDRYSRFAKLGGEMVSLADLEQRVRDALSIQETPLIATALPDERKGEKLILLIEGDHDETDVKNKILKSSIPPLMRPAHIFVVETVPILGSGKQDFSAARNMAKKLIEQQ
ncbi:MAG: acyl-[ACP]--phospholipid O-acyltransferase [Hyphomicrobiales bacterium]